MLCISHALQNALSAAGGTPNKIERLDFRRGTVSETPVKELDAFYARTGKMHDDRVFGDGHGAGCCAAQHWSREFGINKISRLAREKYQNSSLFRRISGSAFENPGQVRAIEAKTPVGVGILTSELRCRCEDS
jgi:hypothetical protein